MFRVDDVARAAYRVRMMSMPLFHVSHVRRGSMLGPPVTNYLRVVAPSASQAVAMAEKALAAAGVDVTTGEWAAACAGSVANDEGGVVLASAA